MNIPVAVSLATKQSDAARRRTAAQRFAALGVLLTDPVTTKASLTSSFEAPCVVQADIHGAVAGCVGNGRGVSGAMTVSRQAARSIMLLAGG
jgi:hypothetical protein